MGKMDLVAVICWLTLAVNCAQDKTVNSSLVDNVSAESVRHEFKVYASGLPHGSYKYQGSPREPAGARSDVVPVKEETLVLHKQNGFLKDSYGNKFLETPHKVAYKTTFPQQFVNLQDLPLHLSEPLVEGKGFTFLGNPPKVAPVVFNSGAKAAGSSPALHFNAPGSFYPSVYAENVKSFSFNPGSFGPARYSTSPLKQSSNHQAVYADKFNKGFYPHEPIQKFQRLQEKPRSNAPFNTKQSNQRGSYKKPPSRSPQSAAANQVIVTHDNGQKTVVILDSKPPVPLLDLSLLEPLHFDNPIVPQVQHFLPKIEYNIPQIEAKKHHDEFIVSKTKSYNSGDQSSKEEEEENVSDDEDNNGNAQGEDSSAENNDSSEEQDERPKPTKKTNSEPPRKVYHSPNKKTVVVVTNKVRNKPVTYEINTPNLKETYNEQVVSYNKKTNSEPVHYSYDSKMQNKPVQYSYSRSTQDPVKSKSITYESKNGGPMKITYYETPDSRENVEDEPPRSSEASQKQREDGSYNSSAEDGSSSEDDEPVQHDYYQEVSPKQSHDLRPEHREQVHTPNSDRPKLQHYSLTPVRISQNSPKHEIHRQDDTHKASRPEEPSPFMVLQTFQPITLPPQIPAISVSPQFYEEDIRFLPTDQPLGPVNVEQEPQTQALVVHEHYPQQNQGPPPQNVPQHLELQPQQDNLQEQHNPFKQPQQKSLNELSEIISFPQLQRHGLGPRSDHAPAHQNIRGAPHHNHNSEQHNEFGPKLNNGFVPVVNHDNPQPQILPQNEFDSSPENEYSGKINTDEHSPHIMEKSRKIIIQEETPEEKHLHREQMVAEMIKQQENNEAEFEKSYKAAAYGFPEFERSTDDEKDIYNPISYGVNKDDEEHIFEHAPFEQYQSESDQFPKSARLQYKDERDDFKEDYYLDYAVKKPESLTDRHKSKYDYYKLFKKQRPERNFGDQANQEKKESSNFYAKYQNAPMIEYNFANEAPRDSFAHASGPLRTANTFFVEPQFQYGFEPINIPHLLDAELSAMSSNLSPNSEKPATRKKVYKENWYIKKTSTQNSPKS